MNGFAWGQPDQFSEGLCFVLTWPHAWLDLQLNENSPPRLFFTPFFTFIMKGLENSIPPFCLWHKDMLVHCVLIPQPSCSVTWAVSLLLVLCFSLPICWTAKLLVALPGSDAQCALKATNQHVLHAAGTGVLRKSFVRGSSAKGHWLWA